MSKAQQVVEMVREQFGLDAEVEEAPCEGQNFFDWDTTGEYAMECSRMGMPRPHLGNVPFCDRHNQELS